MPGYMCSACFCVYTAIDPTDIKLLFKKHTSCLCLEHSCCIAMGDEGYGTGFEKSVAAIAAAKAGKTMGNICDLKMFCCKCSLKFPEIEIKTAQHCLCIKGACSIPFDDEYVEKPTCAICFFQVMPEAGPLKEAPELPKIIRE